MNQDLRKLRAGSASNNKPVMYNQYHRGGPISRQQGSMYLPTIDNGMASIAQGFSGMNLQNSSYQTSNTSNAPMAQCSSDMGGAGHAVQPSYVFPGQMLWSPHLANGANTHEQHGLGHSPGLYNHNMGQPYLNGGAYANYSQQAYNHSPISQSWPSTRVPSSEMPTLITPRRGSSSSNENEAPGTPFTQYTGYGGVAVVENSPNSLGYPWSTPSPSQNGYAASKSHVSTISPGLQLLVQQQPSIPPAVPDQKSPPKPLDRSLENPKGVTNVYVRGLLPTTTDDMLYQLAVRFGDIISHKSIIDMDTGLCKGFGFIKYYNFKDAENCIRGFHYMGYETSFARESFYSQLKKLSDEKNTNLYVSNLPKEMNEHELASIFGPHKVCSSRILRDNGGNGRGVGFARFESRDVCEEVIKNYSNTPVAKPGGEEHLIQIRYADTQEQKSLKQQTAAARQYRSAEYDAQTQGGRGYPDGPKVFGLGGSSLRQVQSAYPSQDQTAEDFESYLNRTAGTRTPVGTQQYQNASRSFARDRLNNVASHLSPKNNGNGLSSAVDNETSLIETGAPASTDNVEELNNSVPDQNDIESAD